MVKRVNRLKTEIYPDYTAYIAEIRKNGISDALLRRIIRRHRENALYNRRLYERYRVDAAGVPIFGRSPRFTESDEINNTINNDFVGEIVGFKTGYFAGKPISYGYSRTEESQALTGGEAGVEAAGKAVTDFTVRNNMFGVDMELTKHASLCGYAGRLFYVDPEGNERCMATKSFESIFLSNVSISEPLYAVRYYSAEDLNGAKIWYAEFYDDKTVSFYEGRSVDTLAFQRRQPHMFDYCPFQGIANNNELTGDAEKVLAAIDAYDDAVSDNANEIEAFAHAYMCFDGVSISDEQLQEARKSGAFRIPNRGGQNNGNSIYFLTKEVNDAFTENHLKRLEDNIYRFSRTPNLTDETFGTASGESLKFKLTGHETKCGEFQAKFMDAANYMWKLLASAWRKKRIFVDPLQVTMEFTRNFPLSAKTEAEAMAAYKNLGMPMEWIVAQMASVDDPGYVLDLIEAEKQSSVPSLTEDDGDDDFDDGITPTASGGAQAKD